MTTTARAILAQCDEARGVQLAWLRARAIRGDGDSGDAASDAGPRPQRRRAWVTLLTNAAYAHGVRALANSLAEAESDFPLVVLVTDSVPSGVREQCTKAGCEVREVEPLPLPPGVGGAPQYACAHFSDCWHKLRVWEMEDEFDQVALLDADMVVLKNIDELLTQPISSSSAANGDDAWAGILSACRVRAVHECFCNVKRDGTKCVYLRRPDEPAMAQEAGPAAYFNSGLVVLRPSRTIFASMLDALAVADLSRYAFPDQDFLNEFFCCAWDALPYTYNATKGMYSAHRLDMWDLAAVRNLHFTMAKPWDLRHPCHKGFESLNQLWRAAFAEPHTLTRVLLRVHLAEKKARKQQLDGGMGPRPGGTT